MNRRTRIANLVKANLHIVDGSVWKPILKDGDGDYVVKLLEVTPVKRIYYDDGEWLSRGMDDPDSVPDSAHFVGYAGKSKEEENPVLVTDEEAEVGGQMVPLKVDSEGWGEWSIKSELESDESVINHVARLEEIDRAEVDEILEEIQFSRSGV